MAVPAARAAMIPTPGARHVRLEGDVARPRAARREAGQLVLLVDGADGERAGGGAGCGDGAVARPGVAGRDDEQRVRTRRSARSPPG